MSAIKDFTATLNKPVLVYGLGKSGVSTVKALRKAGAEIVIGDDNADNLKKFKNLEIYEDQDLSNFAFVVLSPGIPLTHPEPHDVVKKAQEAGTEIICDIELFMRIYPDVHTIGVTGTNGKSTTSALINHIINNCDLTAELAGNIGKAIFDLNMTKKPDWLVLEISSFQIDLCTKFRPDIGVIMNVTPDHIDRHGTIENYAAVKSRLIEPSEKSPHNRAIICTDDDYTKNMEHHDRVFIEVSVTQDLENGVSVQDNILSEDGIDIGSLEDIASLKGGHNAQNAAAAFAAARSCGLEKENIWKAIESFPGLNHRQFRVRTINGVAYVNDSKSTNAASAAVALGCRENVYWIVGGRRKKTGLDGLEEFFDRIKHAFVIGEATDDFSDWFDKYGMEYSKAFTLEKALRDAHKMAQDNRGQPGGAGVVLLSPACASLDQFDSFEHRGDVFSELVEALEE